MVEVQSAGYLVETTDIPDLLGTEVALGSPRIFPGAFVPNLCGLHRLGKQVCQILIFEVLLPLISRISNLFRCQDHQATLGIT